MHYRNLMSIFLIRIHLKIFKKGTYLINSHIQCTCSIVWSQISKRHTFSLYRSIKAKNIEEANEISTWKFCIISDTETSRLVDILCKLLIIKHSSNNIETKGSFQMVTYFH